MHRDSIKTWVYPITPFKTSLFPTKGNQTTFSRHNTFMISDKKLEKTKISHK